MFSSGPNSTIYMLGPPKIPNCNAGCYLTLIPVVARSTRHGSAAAHLLGLLARIPAVHGCLSLVVVERCQAEVSASL